MTKKIKLFFTLIALVLSMVLPVGAAVPSSLPLTKLACAPKSSQARSAAEKETEDGAEEAQTGESDLTVEKDGCYTSKEEVALYIHLYEELPSNFITKKEAKALGWISSEGNLDEVAPGKSIGGDRFGNYEGLLPEKDGRSYRECDIDYSEGARNAKRIVFSNDGLIYYTEDHYSSFEKLYG